MPSLSSLSRKPSNVPKGMVDISGGGFHRILVKIEDYKAANKFADAAKAVALMATGFMDEKRLMAWRFYRSPASLDNKTWEFDFEFGLPDGSPSRSSNFLVPAKDVLAMDHRAITKFGCKMAARIFRAVMDNHASRLTDAIEATRRSMAFADSLLGDIKAKGTKEET